MQYFLSFILVTASILSLYGYGVWNFFLIATIIGVLWYTVKRKNVFPFFFEKSYIVYTVYFILISLLLNGIRNFPFGVGLYLFLVVFYMQALDDKQVFLKTYRIVALVCIAVLVAQNLGYTILGIIPFLPLAGTYGGFDTIQDFAYRLSWERPCAFFAEPAHFAVFLLPLIAIELFQAKDVYGWFRCAIYIAAMLLLRSGTGMIGLGGILLIYMLYILFQSRTNILWRFVFTVIIVFVAITVGSYYFGTQYGQSLMNRSDEVMNLDSDYSSSGYVRIFRGFDIYAQMKPTEKLFGSSKNAIVSYATQLYWTDAMGDITYMSTFCNFLCRTGIFGTIFFYWFLLSLFTKSNAIGKAILFSFFCISFVSACYFTPTMILFLTTSHLFKREEYNKVYILNKV